MSDIAIAVREGADAVMLSGETAYGKFCFKAVDVMSTVAHRTESAMLRFSVRHPDPPHTSNPSHTHLLPAIHTCITVKPVFCSPKLVMDLLCFL